MKRVRIVERTSITGSKRYVIQQKHFLLWWWWVDASINGSDYANDVDSFDTIEEAMRNLYRFDGTKGSEKVIYDSAESR